MITTVSRLNTNTLAFNDPTKRFSGAYNTINFGYAVMYSYNLLYLKKSCDNLISIINNLTMSVQMSINGAPSTYKTPLVTLLASLITLQGKAQLTRTAVINIMNSSIVPVSLPTLTLVSTSLTTLKTATVTVKTNINNIAIL